MFHCLNSIMEGLGVAWSEIDAEDCWCLTFLLPLPRAVDIQCLSSLLLVCVTLELLPVQ